MSQTIPENIIEELLRLGYQEDEEVGDRDNFRFFFFKQITNDSPTVIIVIYYNTALTMRNSGFIFKEGREVMLKHLNETIDKKDAETKVAFILALSQGISATMLTVHTLTSGITKISDRKLRPTILFSPQKQSNIKILETISRLIRREGRNNMVVTFNEKSIITAHEEALVQAK